MTDCLRQKLIRSAPFFLKIQKRREIHAANFMIRFLICNVFISGIAGILFIAKRIFKNNLSNRMQYHLWFLLLGLLAVPFVPFHLIGFPLIMAWQPGKFFCSQYRNRYGRERRCKRTVSQSSVVFSSGDILPHPEIPSTIIKLIAAKPIFQNQPVFFHNIAAASSPFYIFRHTDYQNRAFRRLLCRKDSKPS